MAEFFPALAPYLEGEGLSLDHPALARLAPPYGGTERTWYEQTPEERAATRTPREPWWSAPAGRTLDLATALFPELLYERLDELGIDFGVVYPSLGLVFLHTPDERYRRGTCRALNRANAATFASLADRLAPVAAIPMHTPEEAVEELEFRGGRARVQSGGLRRVRATSLRRTGREGSRRVEVRLLARSVRDRLGLRLRPGVVQGRRARRVDRLPFRFHRDDPVPIDLELRVQPPVHAGRGPAVIGQVTVPGRGHPPVPRPELRLPGGRGGLGCRPLLRPHRPLGEAQPGCSPGQSRPGARRPVADGCDGGEVRPRRTRLPGAADPAAGGGRGHPGRVGRVRHREGRGHQDALRATVSSSDARPTIR